MMEIRYVRHEELRITEDHMRKVAQHYTMIDLSPEELPDRDDLIADIISVAGEGSPDESKEWFQENMPRQEVNKIIRWFWEIYREEAITAIKEGVDERLQFDLMPE